MRFDKAEKILYLAQLLASNFDGLTLDDICERLDVKRRTAERMRDTVETTFGALDHIEDGRKRRFRLTTRGLGNFATIPTVAELTELENAARALEASQAPDRAKYLHSLRAKIGASLREDDRRKLSRNVADQLCFETLACQVGPRPVQDPSVLSALREAMLGGKKIRFYYRDEEGNRRWRKVIPYGLIFGPRYYLVASIKPGPDPFLYRLDLIDDVKVTDELGVRPEIFDLKNYAERSFGVFQEEPHDVVLRFEASAARDARGYLFHPSQTLTDEPDGALVVRFHAGALLQIVHHLLTWGPTVTIVAPLRLQEIMCEQVKALYRHYVEEPASTGSKRLPSTRYSTKSSSQKTPITSESSS
ncbi:WYL domain-containing protein [Rhodoblastus sp. 17X3]|uniref:helix-turn-helix transcriptional regulator n=1 Tax=Rhodoblastus sp. 17X3 TaxID=3047026 RepID=UPI0024B6E739|nr:WYL domain-containing protein [Rhodoblastus sp. 17X3]MDI9849513.1 WYL domain-containing protein [Rhodoblastus sp. 17X3]